MSSQETPQRKRKKVCLQPNKYCIPKNSNWTEAAYHRDINQIVDRQELNQRTHTMDKDPLFREVMYPLIGLAANDGPNSQSHTTSRSTSQSKGTQRSWLTSGNQPIPAESFVSSADRLAVDIADEPHDSIPIAQAPSIRTVADELTAAVSSKEMQKIIADDLTDNTASFDNFKLDPDTWEDEGDEEVYYEPATTVKELEHRLQDLGNMHCVGLLRYLRIDWIRLRMRPKMANGCYLNVERASFFYRSIDFALW